MKGHFGSRPEERPLLHCLHRLRKDQSRDLCSAIRSGWLNIGDSEAGASVRANKALADALEQNPHVSAYVTGKKRMPSSLSPLIGMGDEEEAIAYAHEYFHQRRTPAAIERLSACKPSKPVRSKARRSSARKRKRR